MQASASIVMFQFGVEVAKQQDSLVFRDTVSDHLLYLFCLQCFDVVS